MSLQEYSRRDWPDTLEIDGRTFNEESLGAYKQVYSSADGGVAVVPSRGTTLEERALHSAVIIHNEEQQRNHGINTATSYETAGFELDDEKYIALLGDYRDDLLIEADLSPLVQDDREMQQGVYEELFIPVRELAEAGRVTTSPLDFINIDSEGSSLIFDVRNFGYCPETHSFYIIDNGELEEAEFRSGVSEREGDLSEYPFAKVSDFTYERPQESLEQFLEENGVRRKAEKLLESLD